MCLLLVLSLKKRCADSYRRSTFVMWKIFSSVERFVLDIVLIGLFRWSCSALSAIISLSLSSLSLSLSLSLSRFISSVFLVSLYLFIISARARVSPPLSARARRFCPRIDRSHAAFCPRILDQKKKQELK